MSLDNSHGRVRRVVITPELLCQLLMLPNDGISCDDGKVFIQTTRNPIPEGSRGLRAGIDDSGRISLIVEHPLFERIAEGDLIPQLTIHYERSQRIGQ